MPIEWKALYIDDDTVYAEGIQDELNGVKVLEPDHILLTQFLYWRIDVTI
jgi:hypothetical protein